MTGGAGRPLHVVVVAYGPPEGLARALAPLAATFPAVVVDNAGDPGAAEVARRSGARYLAPGRNIGFAAAVNLALAAIEGHAGGRAVDVLLLNPDAVVKADVVAALQRSLLARPAFACAAPRQTEPLSGVEQPVAWGFTSPARAWREALGLGRANPGGEFLVGSVLLLRSEALADVGLFDERYFLYSEECDWQQRAVRRGWQARYDPTVTAVHAGGATGGDPDWREAVFHASVERYVRKWHGPGGWASFRTANVVGAAARVALGRGTTRRRARARLTLYLRGPVAVAAGLAPNARSQPPPTGSATPERTSSNRPIRRSHR